jgi:hypothetical protein
MNDNLKLYKLIINDTEDQENGVTAISLVEQPAVNFDFLKFNNEFQKYSLDEDQHIITGVAMLANVPIYRNANNKIKEDHYVIFDRQTIKDIVLKFFKENLTKEVNLDHNLFFDGAYMFESYIVNRELGINPPKAFSSITDGSWIVSYKIDQSGVWNMIKKGDFKGFSIEGYFDYEDLNKNKFSNENDLFISIHKLLTLIK